MKFADSEKERHTRKIQQLIGPMGLLSPTIALSQLNGNMYSQMIEVSAYVVMIYMQKDSHI